MGMEFATIAVGDALPERQHTATEVQLFMYNAVIWNPHRIHYDRPYAVSQEGYPELVIDGPLQGDWLAQIVTDWMGDLGTLVSFSFANRRAVFLGETMTAGGRVEAKDDAARQVTLRLHLKNGAGEVTVPGQAVVTFF